MSLKEFNCDIFSLIFLFHSLSTCNCPQDMIVIQDKALTIPPIIACGKKIFGVDNI
jgi:hypothetical protein